jgi:hypothetical protein
MNKILLTLAVASAAFLSACGGGDSEDTNPLDRYVSSYDYCDKLGTETVLNITKPSANRLSITYITNKYKFGSCSGGLLSSAHAGTYTFNYTGEASKVNTYGYPNEGNWNNTQTLDTGIVKGDVVGLLLENSSFYYTVRKVTTSGGYYYDVEQRFTQK